MTWDGSNRPVAGSVSSTTSNGSGYFLLAHNLGYAPTWLAVEANNSRYVCRADLTTATTTTVAVYVRDLAASGAVATFTGIGAYRWLAFP